jgi:hypothetical protein
VGAVVSPRWILQAAACLLLLAACDVPLGQIVTPPARPVSLPAEAQPTSPESAALRSYFAQVQSTQLQQDLLRQDGGGPDTPFTADMLARNFENIAFFNEYGANFQRRGGQSPLRRWDAPVRFGLVFGDRVPPSQRARDTEDIQTYATRLARITGHPISTRGRPNFMVVIASEDDRDAALAEAAAQLPAINPATLDQLSTLERDTYCLVIAYTSGEDGGTYTAALALIRAENPDLLRLSCIHEELAQGLGLANDSPGARPSIFNDDDEFALLTDHDELLLQMLYDDRLTPGMSAEEAAPITRIIARELTGGPL